MKNPFESFNKNHDISKKNEVPISSKINNVIDFAKREGKLLSVGMITFLASCSGPEAPSQSSIYEYFKNTPDAEKIELSEINSLNSTFKEFKEKLIENKSSVLDLNDGETSDVAFNNAELINDSTVYIDYLDQMKTEKETIPLRSKKKYIFHENGDIELQRGSWFSSVDQDPKYIDAVEHIDGKTGGVVYYKSESVNDENYFSLRKDGQMEIGRSYVKGEAGKDFASFKEHFDLINSK